MHDIRLNFSSVSDVITKNPKSKFWSISFEVLINWFEDSGDGGER